MFDLKYNVDDGFSWHVLLEGNEMVFTLDEMEADQVHEANAEAEKMFKWLQINLNEVKNFAAITIFQKYGNMSCAEKTPQKLSNKLPMPSSVYIGLQKMSEIVFDDMILDELFCGTCYEIVVQVNNAGEMQDVFLHKYA